MTVTARYFDVNAGQWVRRALTHLTPELRFAIQSPMWPVKDFDALPTHMTFKTRVFRLAAEQPDAGRGVYDYVFHRTRNS